MDKSKHIGRRVVARESGWKGTIVRIRRNNPSSPYVVKWDKTGRESSTNFMAIRFERDT